MKEAAKLLAAVCLGGASVGIIMSLANQPSQTPSVPEVIPTTQYYPVPERSERQRLVERIADSDLSEESKSLFQSLAMQPMAWKTGLIDNLGLASITETTHDPKLVKQVICTFDLLGTDSNKWKAFLADGVGPPGKRGQASYLVTNHESKLTAWQPTLIDGQLILETKLDGNAFPAVLHLSEASRHNGDVGHFKFRLTEHGIDGINNDFGGLRWPPPRTVVDGRVQMLEAQERRLIRQLRAGLALPEADVEIVCSELEADSERRRRHRCEMETRWFEQGFDAEDLRIASSRSLDEYEKQVQSLSWAESDAFRGQLDRLLELAIERGLVGTVEIAVATGIDLNLRAANGSPPLHEALVSSCDQPIRLRMIEILLDGGADPNAFFVEGEKGTIGQSPLMFALNECHPPLVKALLDSGADSQATDKLGRNALHLLAYTPHHKESPTIARLLIDAGCDVNNTDNRGKTVMHVLVMSAASYPKGIDNSAQFLRQVLDQKPDLSVQDSRGYRALQSKRMHHVPEAFEEVLSRVANHEVAKPWIDTQP